MADMVNASVPRNLNAQRDGSPLAPLSEPLFRSLWVAAVISYVAGIGAARRLGARLASFIGMAEVLFAILFAWLLLGQLPTPVQFLGGGFILAGVVMVRLAELRPAGPAPAPEQPRPAELAHPQAAGR